MLTAGPTGGLLGAADPARTLSPGGRAAAVEDVQRVDRQEFAFLLDEHQAHHSCPAPHRRARRATSHLLLVQAIFFQSEV
ncbi:hypothetical protein [Streptomyces chryseus]